MITIPKASLTGLSQICQRIHVHREITNSRSIFRTHITDRCPIGDAQLGHTRSEKFHKLSNDSHLAQILGDRQHQIRRRGQHTQLADQLVADHFGQQHRNRLTQHNGLRLNATDAPSHHAQSIDHGRVRVRSHNGVRIQHVLSVGRAIKYDASQILQVDLVHDSGTGRNDQHIVECLGAPFQEREALLVALELQVLVFVQRVGSVRK